MSTIDFFSEEALAKPFPPKKPTMASWTAPLRDGHTFMPHQIKAIEWMIEREATPLAVSHGRGGILADEPGMGKTLMTIGLMLARRVPRTLIVAPKSVVAQWASEIRRFSDLTVEMIERSDKDPLKPGDLPEVTVVSYSVLRAMRQVKSNPSLQQTFHWILDIPWNRVVLDEAHVIKNHKSQTAKGAFRLSLSATKFALSGTPIQNSRSDMVTLAGWIGYTRTDDIRQMCKDLVLRRTMEDVPEFTLPPLESKLVEVEFSPEERELYDSVEDYARRRLARAMSKANRNNLEILEIILRCRQLCSHPQIFIEGMRKKYSVDYEDDLDEDLIDSDWEGPASKIDALVSTIEQRVPEGDKAIVFCSFVQEMRLTADALAGMGMRCVLFHGQMNQDKRLEALETFRCDPSARILVAQIQAGGVGLNLQGANHVFVMSPQWNPMWEIQALGRCYRHGQTKPVTLMRMVVKDTIDTRICEIQNQKLQLVSTALDDPRITTKLSNAGPMTLTLRDVKRMFRKQ
jgi:transcription termination factor 2